MSKELLVKIHALPNDTPPVKRDSRYARFFASILVVPAMVLFLGVASVEAQIQRPLRITADLSDVPRKLVHAEIDIPVSPGPLTLTSPEWIPGTHSPSGPIEDLAGFTIKAGSQTIDWRRDSVNLFCIHLSVPAGVNTLQVRVSSVIADHSSPKLFVFEWERVLVYPAVPDVSKLRIVPSVILPTDWKSGTSLQSVEAHTQGERKEALGEDVAPRDIQRFREISVDQLQDSPVLIAAHLREYRLAANALPERFLDVAADLDEETDVNLSTLAKLSEVVRQTELLMKSHHYETYHFLVTVSDTAGAQGLEHGSSSNNGFGQGALSGGVHDMETVTWLTHEYIHSWDGKYRRPVDLYQTDFSTAQQGDLLWVYEGLTEYLCEIVSTRAGGQTPQQYRDQMAATAGLLENTRGREWRSTEDTAISSQLLKKFSPTWRNLKRGQDYYFEGVLLWLDIDTLIREKSSGKKSLDDFAGIFFGLGGNTGSSVVPYDREEVIRDLGQVLPFDWKSFISERIDSLQPHADLMGIDRGGYELTFADEPTATAKTFALNHQRGAASNPWYSLGIQLNNDGVILDVRQGSAADHSKLAPGQTIYAVDGEIYSVVALRRAVRNAMGYGSPIQLILQEGGFVTTATLDYHNGERYPTLARRAGTPNVMDEITKPLNTR